MNAAASDELGNTRYRHPLLFTRARVRIPFLCFWWVLVDPCAGKEGTIVHVEWDTVRGETRYTVLFENDGDGIKKIYTRRSLDFLE